ncbi:Ribonuclease 2 [Morella rubra]|uniref:Ribonuclease 2 n=1 Tax=Morella rubra TaxID=262757 RepID=A0A6A1WSF5_9ROSI|nr:Ribonuclease 2 [Morella rubra]
MGSSVEKHGTCCFPVVRDEYSYFLTALNVYFKYNVTLVLNEAGYIPSNTEKYPLGGIVSAIENAFHATPLVVCSEDSVKELHLCFYKDFKPRDCAVRSSIPNHAISSKSSCPHYVKLPYVSQDYIVAGNIVSIEAVVIFGWGSPSLPVDFVLAGLGCVETAPSSGMSRNGVGRSWQ